MATKKQKKETPGATELALQLAKVRARMAADKALNDTLTAAFKEALKREGKTKAGNYYVRQDPVFKVVSQDLALKFALERGLVKVETGRVMQAFSLDAALRFADPIRYGFERGYIEKVVQVGKPEENT